jgi:hypothetical protein
MNRSSLIALLPLVAAVSACATSGEYPSLARRSFEAAPAETTVPPPVALPSDASVRARIAAALTRARAGIPTFDAALAKARADTVDAAGSASGSDSWIAAQLSISRVEPMLEPATSALADLDNEKRALMLADPASPDGEALDAAIAEVAATSQTQGAALRALEMRLSR